MKNKLRSFIEWVEKHSPEIAAMLFITIMAGLLMTIWSAYENSMAGKQPPQATPMPSPPPTKGIVITTGIYNGQQCEIIQYNNVVVDVDCK